MATGVRDQSGEDLTVSHEINVTPFIDVMLVLLIIFMVAAPLATVDINVDLPASTAAAAPRPDKPVFVTLTDQLALMLGDQEIARPDFAPTLDAITKGDHATRIYLRADRNVDYGALMETINLLRAAGYVRVGLVGLETPPQPGATP